MSLAGPNRKPALTAAASKIGYSRQAAGKIKEAPWVDRAWTVYDKIGAIFIMTRYREHVARKVDFFAAIVDSPGDDPIIDAIFNEKGDITGQGDAAKALQVEGGPEMLRRVVSELMTHWDVAGEAYLVRFDTEPLWRVLSTRELQKSGDVYAWGDQENKLGDIDKDEVYRVWKPHPRFHWQADSPTKHILEDAEELILIGRELRARSQSRIPAGVWILSDGVDFTPFGEDNEAGTEDDFAAELTTRMSRPLTDVGSADALVPWILTMNPTDADIAIRGFVSFTRNWDIPLEQRDALQRSIATGLDLPPEIVTGMADLNHWSAWLVSEQAVSQHVSPSLDDVLDSLTVNWFRPILEAAGMGKEQAARYVLWRDTSPATVAPDRSDTALALFDRNAIDDTALRRVTDFDDDDAPDDIEGEAIMDADELLKRINALGTLRRAGAEWEDATRAVGLPPIALIPGLLPITVKAEEVVRNEAAPITASEEPISQAWLDQWVVDTLKSLEGDPPLTGAAVTAAARRRIVATELADLDAELLTWVQDQADKEIQRLIDLALTAQVDPLDESMLSSLAQKLDTQIARAQAAARAWLTRLLGRSPSADGEDLARSQGVQVIVGGILEAARRKLFTPQAAPDPIETGVIGQLTTPTQAIRHGLSLAGGGPAVYEDGKAAELVGNGQRVHDELAEDGFFQDGYVWKYGHPANTFEPHLHLDGRQFLSWEDPLLAVNFGDSWLRRSFYAPGDHKGCCCAFIQVIAQFSPASPDRLGKLREAAPVKLPGYVNPRPDPFTLNDSKATAMSPAQITTVQNAFREMDQRFPGMLDELQEISTSPDVDHATKTRWQIVLGDKYMNELPSVRNQWAGMHRDHSPGCIATKAGGAASDITYLHNVALHEFSHIGFGRFQQIATVDQRNRLHDLFTTMQRNRSDPTLDDPFETTVSLYADENQFEFVAEALSDAVIGDSPNVTSLKVLELFDEVFGR